MAKRKGQWFGDKILQTIQTTAAANVLDILPSAASLQSMRDVVHERTIISFQTRRILSAAAIEGYAYEVWLGRLIIGTSSQANTKDPLNVGATSQFSAADANTMHFGPLEVPEAVINGFDGAVVQGRTTAEQIEVPVKRKVNRANEGIFLAVTADVSNALKCLISWRSYYTYA